jgi:hypothetical protein
MFSGATIAAEGPNDGPGAAAVGVGIPDLGQAQLFAVIRANGTIARTGGANPATTNKIAGFTGAYQVGFNRNIRGCVYIGTLGGSINLGTPPDGFVVVEGRFNNLDGVFVQTFDAAGRVADRGFHLYVDCD